MAESKITALRSIAMSGRPGYVDGILVSPPTAAKLAVVHDKLSPPFRKKFLAQRVDVMVALMRPSRGP